MRIYRRNKRPYSKFKDINIKKRRRALVFEIML